MSPFSVDLTERILASVPIAVGVLSGEELRVVYGNRKAAALFGIGAEAIGRRFEDVFPQVQQSFLALIRRVLRSGEAVALSTFESVTLPSGTTAYFELELQPIDTDGDGSVDAVVVMVQDVSSYVDLRREAERRAQEAEEARKALAESKARLRLAIRPAPISLCNRDRELRLTWLCKGESAQTPASLLGLTPEDLYQPEEASALREFYRPVLERGETAHRLLRFTDPDNGCDRWVELYAQPLRDDGGEVIGTSCAGYDVSDLVRTREALAERESLLELAMATARMGEWEYDLKTRTLRHSRNLARLYELPENATETPLRDLLARLHPDDVAGYCAVFQQALRDGSPTVYAEARTVLASGEERWIASYGLIQPADGRRPRRMFGVALDVTDQKRETRQLAQRNHELERFAQLVAHDLRSPLMTVQGFGSRVLRSARERLAETELSWFESMLGACRQMGEIIDGLLNFALAAHGETPHVPVDLQQVVAQVLERLAGTISAVRAEVNCGPLPRVRGQPVLLTQALQNLISNALKFHDGRAPRVDINAWPDKDGWVIEVRDNGIGIPPEHQPQLFAAFARAHADRGYPGIGLGLAFVKSVLERHGGRIWVESKVGEGASFRFWLPAAEPVQETASEPVSDARCDSSIQLPSGSRTKDTRAV